MIITGTGILTGMAGALALDILFAIGNFTIGYVMGRRSKSRLKKIKRKHHYKRK